MERHRASVRVSRNINNGNWIVNCTCCDMDVPLRTFNSAIFLADKHANGRGTHDNNRLATNSVSRRYGSHPDMVQELSGDDATNTYYDSGRISDAS